MRFSLLIHPCTQVYLIISRNSKIKNFIKSYATSDVFFNNYKINYKMIINLGLAVCVHRTALLFRFAVQQQSGRRGLKNTPPPPLSNKKKREGRGQFLPVYTAHARHGGERVNTLQFYSILIVLRWAVYTAPSKGEKICCSFVVKEFSLLV